MLVTPVTEQWFAAAISGPNARALLADLAPDIDVSNEALPMMGMAEGLVAGIAARVFRLSFSGEIAYEINVDADYGMALWNGILAAGGAQLAANDDLDAVQESLGHTTSQAYSATLGRHIALALVTDGRRLHGRKLYALSPVMGARAAVEIVPPCFYDPDGGRQRG